MKQKIDTRRLEEELKSPPPWLDENRVTHTIPEQTHKDYAPPMLRPENATLEEIQKLTSEFESFVEAAEVEISCLKKEALEVRDRYVRHMTHIVNGVKRLKEGVRLGRDTMKMLREECVKLENSSFPMKEET